MAEIQSLAKGLKILNLLEHSRNGMGTTEIAKQLSIDKSSASRLLHTLANYGFVEQDEHSTRYLLGPQLLTLGQHLLNRITLRDHAPALFARTGRQNRRMRASGDSGRSGKHSISIRSNRPRPCGWNRKSARFHPSIAPRWQGDARIWRLPHA